MITMLPDSSGKIYGVQASGKLTDADYQQFTPRLEEIIKQHGKVRVLIHMHDFHGWDLKAMWDDSKFYFKHGKDVEKVAMVGDKRWEAWMAKLCKVVMASHVKYFDAAQINDAWAWLRAD